VDADGASLTCLTENDLQTPGTPRSTPEEQDRFSAGTGMLFTDVQLIPQDIPRKRGWGHSTIPQALQLGRTAQPIFPHDPDRTDDQLDVIAELVGEFEEQEFEGRTVLVTMEGTSYPPG